MVYSFDTTHAVNGLHRRHHITRFAAWSLFTGKFSSATPCNAYLQIKLGLTTRVHCSRYNYEIVTILLKFLWLITSKRLSLFPLENRDEKTSFQDGDCWVHTSHNGIQVLAILTRYSAEKYFTLKPRCQYTILKFFNFLCMPISVTSRVEIDSWTVTFTEKEFGS